jgi:hypothetical protein
MRREVSYTDTTIGAVWFNIHVPPSPSSDLANILRLAAAPATKAVKDELIAAVRNHVDEHHWPLRAHEWCHVLQAFAYPALYLRSLRELRVVQQTLDSLQGSGEIKRPFKVLLDPDWLATIRGPQEHVYRLHFEADNTFVLEPASADSPSTIDDITETDLLESDAMIFQFKVERRGEGTGKEFADWLRQPRHYARAFKLAARYLGESNAFVALPALVRSSYETTWPVTAFAHLIELILQSPSDLPMQIGVDRLYDFLSFSLTKNLPSPSQGPDSREPGRQEEFVYLDVDALGRLADQGEYSPLTPYVRTFLARRKADSDYPRWLFHPHEFFTGRDVLAGVSGIDEYRPVISITRILHPEIRLGQSVLEVAPAFADKPWPPLPEMTYQQYLVDWIRYKELVFEMATPAYEGYGHSCPHTACQWHDTSLCRKWATIPKRYEDCWFPQWFSVATLHTLEGQGPDKYLRPLTKEEEG